MGIAGQQVETFAIIVLTGLILGLLFDSFRVMRSILRPRWMIGSVADLTYWLLATVIVFTALLFGNWGELRLYVFIGLLVGVSLYFKFLSRGTVKGLITVLRFVGKIIRAVETALIYLLVKPTRFLLRTATSPLRYLAGKAMRWRKPPDEKPPQ